MNREMTFRGYPLSKIDNQLKDEARMSKVCALKAKPERGFFAYWSLKVDAATFRKVRLRRAATEIPHPVFQKTRRLTFHQAAPIPREK
jgi:hypothetical protein